MLASYTNRIAFICLMACVAVTAAAAQEATSPDRAPRRSPSAVLRSAQTIFIRSKSAYFKPAALEQELLNRREVEDWGIGIARDELDADLIVEVQRKLFTNIFVYTVVEPRTRTVVAGGKVGSLGGSVERQIADSLVKKIGRARSADQAGK